MDGIVTISTASHLFKSYALAESLNRFGYQLHILLVDGDRNTIPPPNIRITHINQLRKEAEKAVKKFRNQPDKLRWTLKPVFVSYLLESGYERVIYVDNDIFFYSSPGFLFEELKSASFCSLRTFIKLIRIKNKTGWRQITESDSIMPVFSEQTKMLFPSCTGGKNVVCMPLKKHTGEDCMTIRNTWI